MQRYYSQIETLEDFGELFRYSCAVCAEQGVVRQSYHFAPAFAAPNSRNTIVYAEGFEKEWLELYERSDFRSADPIPGRIMKHSAMMTWQHAMDAAPNTARNEAYFDAMREYGLIHGFGIPLFGPRGRDAYASFDFGKPVDQVSPDQIGVVRSVPQAAHQRVCVLLEQLKEKPDLSERESEVINWIARGKSVSAIATILDISPDTVKTYTKRIYGKLNVTDRVGAAIKALKLGLVREI